MIDLVKDVPFFIISETAKALTNILCIEQKVDTHVAQDLLSITQVGSTRRDLFVREYILPLPTGPRKRRKRLRKLATFTHKPSTTREGNKREQELSNHRLLSIYGIGNGITCAIVPHSNAPETLPQILSTCKDLVKGHLSRTFD